LHDVSAIIDIAVYTKDMEKSSLETPLVTLGQIDGQTEVYG
jgi:hypothetical protein